MPSTDRGRKVALDNSIKRPRVAQTTGGRITGGIAPMTTTNVANGSVVTLRAVPDLDDDEAWRKVADLCEEILDDMHLSEGCERAFERMVLAAHRCAGVAR